VPAAAIGTATARPAKIASSTAKIERVAAGSMLLSSGIPQFRDITRPRATQIRDTRTGALVNVLVTGHHGYLGSVTGPVLVASGHDVTGLDTLYYRGCDLGTVESALPALELDVRDVTADDLRGFDAVVHLAALSNDPLGDLDPELTYEINFRATVDLARAAREAGVSRFLFASSCSMYGASEDERVTEDAPLKPITAYAESKVRSEEALAELADDDFSPIFMRNATVHGVSPRLRIDIVLNNLVGWAFTTGAVRILSDGTPWRPVIHVADVADATAALLQAPRETVHAQAFNVGADSENYQVRDLAEIAREVVPGSEVEYGGAGDPDPRSYRVDFGKLTRALPELGLRRTARESAQELYDAYGAAGLTFEEFDGPRFTRLKRLQSLLAEGKLGEDLRWR
jgi:nucleoside-diphosphate-sugar epimerase